MMGIEAQDHQHYYDPVIDPSDVIGWLILNDEVKHFSRGLKYLFALEKRSLSESSYHTGKTSYSDQLKRDIPLALMLNEAANILRTKASIGDMDFMDALDDLAVMFPEACTEVSRFADANKLATLILHRELIVRRTMACRSFIPPGISLVEAANDLVAFPNLSLENNDVYFSEYLSWFNLFQGKGLSWGKMLKAVDILIQCKSGVRIHAGQFSDQIEKLVAAVPSAFLGAMNLSLQQGKPCRSLVRLVSDVPRVLQTVEHLEQFQGHEPLHAITHSADLLLKSSPDLGRIQSCLEDLSNIFDFDKGMVDLAASKIVPHRPQWVLDPDKHKSRLSVAVCALKAAFSNREGSIYAMHFDIQTLISGIENCIEVIGILQKYGKSEDEVTEIFRVAGEWVRSLTYPGFIPVSLVDSLIALSHDDVAKFMLNDNGLQACIRERLFQIFGKYSKKVFEEVMGFPELITNEGVRDLAVEVAAIRTVYREEDIHARYIRWYSQSLRPTVLATQIARDVHGASLENCIKVLTVLDAVQLLDVRRIDLTPVEPEEYIKRLAAFLKECNDNPFGLDNFMFLVEGFRKNNLYKINPDEFKRMWQCAFDSVIAAPKVFLDRECFVKEILKIEAENWQFAEMEVHEVLRREPLLLYHTLQTRFNQEEKAGLNSSGV